jgi:hypothetical protein
MKKLELFVEQDFIDLLQDFKKQMNCENLDDEKSMILITWFFMKQFQKSKEKQASLF